jgi:zinc transport system substrate-binding protein
MRRYNITINSNHLQSFKGVFMLKIVSSFFLLTLIAIPQISLAAPKVVVSLKPIHSLVANLMKDVAEPELLINDGGSPHGYSLRPSQAKMLSNADLIIWVGPEMESFMNKPLMTLANKNSQLALSQKLQAQMLPIQQGGSWDRHTHEATDDHDHDLTHNDHDLDHDDHDLEHDNHDDHDHHSTLDQHMWTSPHMAKLISIEAAAALEQIDPDNAPTYKKNLTQLLQRLTQLDEQLQQQLAPVKGVPYIVFHTAYQYFEHAYGLSAVGSVTIDPERQPGAKRISEIRSKIKELGARCIFSEPQFESKLVVTITEGLDVRSGVLDPLGAELEAGPDSYFTLLENLANNLVVGLQK